MIQTMLLVVTLALLVTPAPLGSRAAVQVQAPPNIILIVSDDHAWTDHGFMGHPIPCSRSAGSRHPAPRRHRQLVARRAMTIPVPEHMSH